MHSNYGDATQSSPSTNISPVEHLLYVGCMLALRPTNRRHSFRPILACLVLRFFGLVCGRTGKKKRTKEPKNQTKKSKIWFEIWFFGSKFSAFSGDSLLGKKVRFSFDLRSQLSSSQHIPR